MATRHDGMGDSAMARHHFRNITPTPRPLANLSPFRGNQGIRSSSRQFARFLHSMLDVREEDEALPVGPDWPGLGPGDRGTVLHSSLPNLTLCSGPGPGCLATHGAHRPPVTRPRPGLCQSVSGRVTGARDHEALSRHPAVRAGSASDSGAEQSSLSEDVTRSQPPVTSPGLRYRASVRIMVRDTAPSLTPRPASRTGGEARTQESSVSVGDKVPIVRPAMRLPRDLYDKMPSAPNTPGASRREVTTVAKLASTSPQPTKRVPKSVASMVRR